MCDTWDSKDLVRRQVRSSGDTEREDQMKDPVVGSWGLVSSTFPVAYGADGALRYVSLGVVGFHLCGVFAELCVVALLWPHVFPRVSPSFLMLSALGLKLIPAISSVTH